jgi:single-stranded DNA-binding protein
MLTGALGNDCEVREVGEKKAIKFNVAVNQDYKDATETKLKKPSGFVLFFGNREAKAPKLLTT